MQVGPSRIDNPGESFDYVEAEALNLVPLSNILPRIAPGEALPHGRGKGLS